METLVLSMGYEPLARVSWQRAITLLTLGKVEIVEEYEDREIRSVTVVFRMPSVVRQLRTRRGAQKGVKFSRLNVYTRDEGRCQYCARRVSRSEATYDHVVPRSRGGKTTWENIVIACTPCNQRKAARTPVEAGIKLLAKPVRPKRLPDLRVTLTFRKEMPQSWRAWLRDFAYWHGELEE